MNMFCSYKIAIKTREEKPAVVFVVVCVLVHGNSYNNNYKQFTSESIEDNDKSIY